MRIGRLGVIRITLTAKTPPKGVFTNTIKLLYDFGSGGRDRTYGQAINSRLLYR